MFQLENETPFAAEIALFPDRDGVDTLFTIVKGTFTIDGGRLRLAEEQRPIALVDEHHGEPDASSIRVPSDISLEKPGTDVLVHGCAWAPGGTPTWQMDVGVSVGAARKVARVSGDRVWDASARGASVAWISPFVRLPVVWERAFGGADVTEHGPTADPRNPVGLGFRAPKGAKSLAGLPIPNVEDPAALVSSPADAPSPAGFGPVAPHWQPRVLYAGTYDEAWQRSRAPFLPHDFDPRFTQVAPAGLIIQPHLVGGEAVDLRGFTPDGVLRFALPAVQVRATYRTAGGPTDRLASLDTLIIEPDADRLVMVWRAALRCDKKALKVGSVQAAIVGTAA